MTLAVFHDFPGLENGLTKFHDFPRLSRKSGHPGWQRSPGPQLPHPRIRPSGPRNNLPPQICIPKSAYVCLHVTGSDSTELSVCTHAAVNSMQWSTDRCKTMLWSTRQWWRGSCTEQNATVWEEDRDAVAASCRVGGRSVYHFWIIIKNRSYCCQVCAVLVANLILFTTRTKAVDFDKTSPRCIVLKLLWCFSCFFAI